MSDQVQMNLSVYPELVDAVESLTETYGWSKRETVTVAVQALARVMSKHEDAPRDADDDIRDLYLRVARLIPGDLVEVSRSVELGRVGEQPVIRAEGWLMWEDQATGDLLAREEGGEQRFGRVVDGKIEAFITPAQAVRN